MIGFESNIDTFSANITARRDRLAKLPEALTKAAAVTVSVTKRRFTDNDWAANAASTIRRKGSSRPGIDTGRLRQSIAAGDVQGNSISVGTNVVYAAYLQFGTRGRSSKNGKPIQATPARPFLLFDDPLKAKILAIFRQTLFTVEGVSE